MARVIKRVAAKRDLTDHFVFLGDNASVDVAPFSSRLQRQLSSLSAHA